MFFGPIFLPLLSGFYPTMPAREKQGSSKRPTVHQIENLVCGGGFDGSLVIKHIFERTI